MLYFQPQQLSWQEHCDSRQADLHGKRQQISLSYGGEILAEKFQYLDGLMC
jgi:hypothetical protein